MTSRFRGRCSSLVLLVLLIAIPGCGRPKSAENYNLLLITIDTIRADRIGAYGDSAARTR